MNKYPTTESSRHYDVNTNRCIFSGYGKIADLSKANDVQGALKEYYSQNVYSFGQFLLLWTMGKREIK